MSDSIIHEQYYEPESPKYVHKENAISKVLGGGMSKDERNKMYFGNTPKGTYFGKTDLKTIHNLTMSPTQQARLYGLPVQTGRPMADFVETRLATDSKEGLIRELAEESNLTRAQAVKVVESWMARNNLVEVESGSGKIIVNKR